MFGNSSNFFLFTIGTVVFVKIFGMTDVGLKRSSNQDSIFYNTKKGVLVVADGIGGRLGGETASMIAVEGLKKSFDEWELMNSECIQDFLMDSLSQVNNLIITTGLNDSTLRGMGTTVNCLVFIDRKVFIAHLGDSRTYLFYKDNLWQLTLDHNIKEYVKHGWLPEETLLVNKSPDALVRALGLSSQCEIDLYEKDLTTGEIYLTCSDGLSDMVSNHKIREILIHNRKHVDRIPNLLIEEAKKNGGIDNITIAITEIN